MSHNIGKECAAYFGVNSSLQVWLSLSMPDSLFKLFTSLTLSSYSTQHLVAFFQANLTKYSMTFSSPSFWGTHTLLTLVSFSSSSALSLGKFYPWSLIQLLITGQQVCCPDPEHILHYTVKSNFSPFRIWNSVLNNWH